MENPVFQQIKIILENKFQPSSLEVIDDSHLHHGHRGNIHGGGHYRVIIQSNAFNGLKLIQRHQAIYEALHEFLENKKIHALQIDARDSEAT